MKKQFLIIALVGLITVNFNTLMAQESRPDKKPPQEQADTLTKAQIKKVNKILADYDSESLSADDAKAIMDAIRDAKVPGGKGVENAINDAGFSFEEIRKLAPPPSRPEKPGREPKKKQLFLIKSPMEVSQCKKFCWGFLMDTYVKTSIHQGTYK